MEVAMLLSSIAASMISISITLLAVAVVAAIRDSG